SDATQAPLLNSAIGLAKNIEESITESILPLYLKADVESILMSSTEELKKRTWDAGGTWGWKANNEILNIAEAIRQFDVEIADLVSQIGNQENFNNAALQAPIRERIQTRLDLLLTENIDI